MLGSDSIPIKGHLDLYFFTNPFGRIKAYDPAQHKHLLLNHIEVDNIIFNQGKAEIIEGLTTGTNRVLARMAMGDRGALPSDLQVPKSPDAGRTGLYHEVYRKDIQTVSTTTEGATNEIMLVTTFNAVDLSITSFADQTYPVMNEVMLVMCDLITGLPLPRLPVAAPDPSEADEAGFSMVAFNSVPFRAEQETAVTVRYGIFIQ